jgi:integrase
MPTRTPSSLPVPAAGTARPFGPQTILSRHGFRRLYQHATHRARSDLGHLQLRGPHDLRHSFSTWLEDEGIPARYHTPPPEMAARMIQAVDHRLALVLQVAEATTPAEPDQSDRGF